MFCLAFISIMNARNTFLSHIGPKVKPEKKLENFALLKQQL